MIGVVCSCGDENIQSISTSAESYSQPEVTSFDNIETAAASSTADTLADFSTILEYTYKVPGRQIFVDVPNYQEMEKGYTRLFIIHDKRYVAVTTIIDSSVVGSVANISDAHDMAFSVFKDNIQNYSYVYNLNIITDKTETINGIEVYSYEGTLTCLLEYNNPDRSYEAYVAGYSFIMDGVPCNITGSIIGQEQKQSDIDEMKTIVDAMIQTVRSER